MCRHSRSPVVKQCESQGKASQDPPFLVACRRSAFAVCAIATRMQTQVQVSNHCISCDVWQLPMNSSIHRTCTRTLHRHGRDAIQTDQKIETSWHGVGVHKPSIQCVDKK